MMSKCRRDLHPKWITARGSLRGSLTLVFSHATEIIAIDFAPEHILAISVHLACACYARNTAVLVKLLRANHACD